MKRILIIDDDEDILALLSSILEQHFQPIQASSPAAGIQAAVREQPDLVILDLKMPEIDGYEVCQRLRENPQTRRIPIIVLSSMTELESRVKSLDLGADDFLGKPFQPLELLARINSKLRRLENEGSADEDIVLGNLKLQPRSFQVWVNSDPVQLTRLEFQILRYFLERPNQVIPRTKLLSDLWPDSVVTNRTVDTHVANLRKKLRGFNYPLDTIYGAGYILKTV